MIEREVRITKSEWKVTSNLINSITLYGVYRLRDTNEIDHSGNREYYGNYTQNKEEARATANALNFAETKKMPLLEATKKRLQLQYSIASDRRQERRDKANMTTNYELIKNMGVEEMAVTIACPNDIEMAEIECDKSENRNCCECCLNWLKEKALD